MFRRLCLLLLVLFPASRAAADHPNILFLFADDQRPDTIAAWGNEHIETPHLDRLAERRLQLSTELLHGARSMERSASPAAPCS